LIACEETLLCRVIAEDDGWSSDMVKRISKAANFDEKKALVITPKEETATDAILGVGYDVYIDCLATDAHSCRVIARDSKRNEIKVRQRASRVDSLNHNGRVYPRKVADAAVAAADAWAKSGLMTSELEHPSVVQDCDGGRCTEKFAHNPKRQTATVDRIYPADKDGWIDIERTIKGNTPCGKIVMDAINAGKPLGISTRFHVKGKMRDWNGQKVFVADAMDIATFDDVQNPAVDGAGGFSPVADSVLAFLTGDSETYSNLPNGNQLASSPGPYLGTPFFGENRNTVNPPDLFNHDAETEPQQDKVRSANSALEEKNMYDIPRLIADFKANYSKPGRHNADYVADGCRIVHLLKDAKESGKCVKDALAEFKSAFDSSTIAGYRGGQIAVTVGSEMGGEVGAGWGSEIETATGLNKLTHAAGMAKPEPHGEDSHYEKSTPDAGPKGDNSLHPTLKAILDEKEEEEAKKKMKEEFKKVADEHEELKEDEAMKDSIWKIAKKTLRPGQDMKAFIDAQLKFVKRTAGDAKAIAKAAQIPATGLKGSTLTSTSTAGDTQIASNSVSVMSENRPWAMGTERYLSASDNMARKMRGAMISGTQAPIVDPDSPETMKRRAYNRKQVETVLQDYGARRAELGRDNKEYAIAGDSYEGSLTSLQKAVAPLLSIDPTMTAALDTTTTANVLNQPTVQEGVIVQSFQDLTALEFVMAMGPRGFNGLTGGFLRQPYPIGTNLRVPSISYTNPTGWGYSDGFFDAGLQVPENVGIAPGNTNVSWLDFAISKRKISCILTWDAIKAIGNGPGDISLLSWELYMMAARESRTIDNALYNEMYQVAVEFGAVQVSAEAYTNGAGGTGGNNLLANNSAYVAAGPVVVNLNPKKTAAAAVASGDMSVTYPASVPAGLAQIVGAIRLAAGAPNANAAPYYGFYNVAPYPGTIGPGPIVRPRTTPTLQASGTTSNVTINPISVTLPANMVQGEVTSTGGIWSYPGTTATFAVDYENGTLVFASGAVTGTAGVITTSVTVTYSYATNWVDFVADPTLAAANNLIPTGVTPEQYMNGLFRVVDKVAAQMGSSTNYVKPDCAITNLIGSSYYTPAQIFAPLFSPPATELFPSPSAVAERSGVMFHRQNSSWNGRSQSLLLTRKGSTFYAQDTPFQIQGPVTVQDASGNPTGNIAFYGLEFSVIGTRQPIDVNGNVLNCPNKLIILRLQTQRIGVF
jgi:hypothetical protein